MAFDKIICHAVHFPRLRHIVKMLCEKRNERIEAVTFSWKRPGVGYSSDWLFSYNLASRCLPTDSSPVMDAIAKLDPVRDNRSLDVAHIEEVLSQCR